MLKEKILKIHFLITCLFSCFPLFTRNHAAIVIAIFGTISLLVGLLEYKKIKWNQLNELVICIFPFSLILIWTTCWDQSTEAYFYLERSMSLFIFPLAFFILPIQYSSAQKNIFHGLFIFSSVTKIVYGFAGAAFKLAQNIGIDKHWKTKTDMFNDSSFSFHFRTFFEETTDLHPTYASIFLGVSFLLTLNYFLKIYFESSKIKRVAYSFTLLLIILLQVNLAARTSFLATMIAAFILFFLHQKKKIYVFLAGLIILALSSILVLTVPSFSARLKEISVKNIALPTATNFDSFNIRTGIYKCGFNIVKENWLTGVGPGKVQVHLNSCYDNFSKEVYNGKEYNTHNQFIDYWAGMGILAPLSLLLLLFYVSYHNFKIHNYLPLGLCVLFFVAMLTENVLVRQNGVVSFSYFLSLYCFINSNKPEINFFNPFYQKK